MERKFEKIKELIKEKYHKQLEKDLLKIKKKFKPILVKWKSLNKQIKILEKEKKKIKLQEGYNINYKGEIEVVSKWTLKNPEVLLDKANELHILGKTKESKELIEKLIVKWKLG